uniref:G-protein coupled receptors family 3 profile domain-containing protein n=1 Tax=Xenopus tropicalis TaxID=8364 RepID=A0A1B8Y7K7_XENTR
MKREMIHCAWIPTRELLSDQLKVILCLAAVWVTPCSTELSGSDSPCRSHITKPEYEYKYIQDGDIIIGGVFTVKNKMNYVSNGPVRYLPLCAVPSIDLYKQIRTFLFAIDEINRNPDLLPNITLGYRVYDSCGDPRLAIGSALQILSGPGNVVPNYSCRGKGEIAGFIGDQSSLTSLPIAQLLGVYGYSQISYGATDPTLSDREMFPYYFSTGLSDDIQHIAVAELVEQLGWTWVIIVAPDNDSGEKQSRNLQNEISKHGACVDIIIFITEDADTNKRNFERIQISTAEVIVLCGTPSDPILLSLCTQGSVIHEKTLVVTLSWGETHYTCDLLYNGSLIYIYPNNLNELLDEQFHDYVLSVTEDTAFLKELLSLYPSCWAQENINKTYFMNCTEIMTLKEVGVYFRHNAEVYRSVYTMVHALHTKLSVSVTHRDKYIPINTHGEQTVKSQCSANCPPGSRKMAGKSAVPCCYACVPCSHGEISNRTDMGNCFKCEDNEWPNQEKTLCIEKQIEFLSYAGDPLTLISIISSVILFIIAAVILGIFISFRDTPVVRANNHTLSFILLVSIKLSFLSVFLFLGRPVDITCMLRQTSFGITFSIAVSCVLAKTLMVSIAFKATKPGSPWRKWVGVKLANGLVFNFSLIQFMISVIWLVIAPPYVEHNTHSEPGKIIIQCNEGSAIGFYIVLSYMGLLASVSFIVAFLARSLPDSFNEAKYITFSMLLFCSVWITMIPAYLSTKGKYMVAVEIFAIISSSCGLLFCIFLPKCYIILFKPEMNSKQYLLGKCNT